MVSGHPPHNNGRKIKIEKPVARSTEDDSLWREVEKYQRLIPSEPEPNLGRVREIKEQLRRGTYIITPDIIDDTAARITHLFMRKNQQQ